MAGIADIMGVQGREHPTNFCRDLHNGTFSGLLWKLLRFLAPPSLMLWGDSGIFLRGEGLCLPNPSHVCNNYSYISLLISISLIKKSPLAEGLSVKIFLKPNEQNLPHSLT